MCHSSIVLYFDFLFLLHCDNFFELCKRAVKCDANVAFAYLENTGDSFSIQLREEF